MQDVLRKVEEFHRVFGLYLADRPVANLPPAVLATRIRLFDEEFTEYREAAEAQDIVAIADALTDMLYVLLGTVLSHGLQGVAEDLFAEVHRSNMSKLDADGHAIVRDGKVRKSDLFSEPDLAPILARGPSARPS